MEAVVSPATKQEAAQAKVAVPPVGESVSPEEARTKVKVGS